MKGKSLALIALAIAVLGVAGPLFAHHGSAAYDLTKIVTLTGVITDFKFVNPHVLIYWDVKDEAGNVQRWSGERGGPNSLKRDGWTSKTMKPGDQVTISGQASKNGTHTMRITKIILNGKELGGGGGGN